MEQPNSTTEAKEVGTAERLPAPSPTPCYASLLDGMIELDTDRGEPLGFTSDRFGGGSYLWKRGDAVIVSFIESLQRGNFRRLVDRIRSHGLAVHVPTPLGRMQKIVRDAGYRQEFPYCEQFGECVEVWILDA